MTSGPGVMVHEPQRHCCKCKNWVTFNAVCANRRFGTDLVHCATPPPKKSRSIFPKTMTGAMNAPTSVDAQGATSADGVPELEVLCEALTEVGGFSHGVLESSWDRMIGFLQGRLA